LFICVVVVGSIAGNIAGNIATSLAILPLYRRGIATVSPAISPATW